MEKRDKKVVFINLTALIFDNNTTYKKRVWLIKYLGLDFRHKLLVLEAAKKRKLSFNVQYCGSCPIQTTLLFALQMRLYILSQNQKPIENTCFYNGHKIDL